MGTDTKIAWAHDTINLWIGCDEKSPACAGCYARNSYVTKMRGVKWGKDAPRSPVKNWLSQLRKSERLGRASQTRRRVFCMSLGDLFDDRGFDELRRRLWEEMLELEWVDLLVLTKVPENMEMMLPRAWDRIAPKVWLGVTIENNRYWERLNWIKQYPARFHWVSHEPGLTMLDLPALEANRPFDWLVTGGESDQPDHPARPYPVGGLPKMLDDAQTIDIARFAKQMGTVWAREHGIADKHAADPAQWPPEFRVQEFPEDRR